MGTHPIRGAGPGITSRPAPYPLTSLSPTTLSRAGAPSSSPRATPAKRRARTPDLVQGVTRSTPCSPLPTTQPPCRGTPGLRGLLGLQERLSPDLSEGLGALATPSDCGPSGPEGARERRLGNQSLLDQSEKCCQASSRCKVITHQKHRSDYGLDTGSRVCTGEDGIG